jgi:RNA polymerase sigma-70 factor (ECF subfamily)
MDVRPESLEELLEAHAAEVHGLLVAITRNSTTAADLTQEVFLVAVRKGMVPGDGFRLWLREVARRLAMNELRKKRPRCLSPEVLADLAPASAGDPPGPCDSFDERLAALQKCMEGLPDADRQLLAARYGQNRGLASVADELNQTVGYLKQRLFRLRNRLRDCVTRRMAESEAVRASANA